MKHRIFSAASLLVPLLTLVTVPAWSQTPGSVPKKVTPSAKVAATPANQSSAARPTLVGAVGDASPTKTGLAAAPDSSSGGGSTPDPTSTGESPASTGDNPAAPGAPAGLGQGKGPTEITSRSATLDNRTHIAIFTGEVEVHDPDFNVNCDKLTVYLRDPKTDPKANGGAAAVAKPADPKAESGKEAKATDPKVTPPDETASKKGGDQGGNIQKAIAEGNVIITQHKPDANGKMQDYFGKSKRAVFDNDKHTCVLYGWPRVSQKLEGDASREVYAIQENTVITLDQAGAIKADGPNKVRLSNAQAFQSKPATPATPDKSAPANAAPAKNAPVFPDFNPAHP